MYYNNNLFIITINMKFNHAGYNVAPLAAACATRCAAT